jgi:hypothetical protein
MSRLTLSERERIEKALVAALAPEDPAIATLQRAASDAVFRDYYGEKALRSFAAMPPEWFDRHVSMVHVQPSGAKHYRALPGPHRYAPRTPPCETLGEAAQKAVDAWAAAYDAHDKARRTVAFRVGSIVGRVATMAGLLKLLPEARDILALPPEQDPDEAAAAINAALAARKPKPGAPAAQPAAAKPAKTKPAARKR